jgi:hypothetical protein
MRMLSDVTKAMVISKAFSQIQKPDDGKAGVSWASFLVSMLSLSVAVRPLTW